MSGAEGRAQGQETRFKLRVRYRKEGRLAYLGHLEVIQTVERSIRRAGLPYAVSQGFSPRMRVGYSSALPVGTTSRCEWYDLLLTELVPAPEAAERLVAATPVDLAPARAGYVDVRTPALTAQITRLRYRVVLHPAEGEALDAAVISRVLDGVREQGSVPYLRGRKRKVLDMDRLLVDAVARDAGEGAVELALDTRADNAGSLRPEILLSAVDLAFQGVPAGEWAIESSGAPSYASFSRVEIERTAQLIEHPDGSLVEPLAAGASGGVRPPRSAALGMV